MASMSEHRKRNTFMSYVAPPPEDVRLSTADEWRLPNNLRELYLAKPRTLPGELSAESAPAYMYPVISTAGDGEDHVSKEAIFGLLSVTNFKLAFVPDPSLEPAESVEQENLLLQRYEVTLNNIDLIYQVSEGGRRTPSNLGGGTKRKKLIDSDQKVMSGGRIAALHIICKNFRLLKFSFLNERRRDHGKVIASALARFAFASKHDLSFAYCYREPYYPTLGKTAVTTYATKEDWQRELKRCGAFDTWQVMARTAVPADKAQTLPPHFVIPRSSEADVKRYLDFSRCFCDSRGAFWTYGYGEASLVRLAELKAPDSAHPNNQPENIMLELVRKCDKNRQLRVLALTEMLPSVQDVRRAYVKFRRLCTPESAQHFLLQDAKFLTLVEKSNWLFYVSLCLRYSCQAAQSLRDGCTCVLQETNGRDLCCVVSSVTQIVLDPLYRTIDGFQSLVQKDWVALEHPFQRRLGHVRTSPEVAEEEESPVFLLFLDCVWQLLQQFPDEFEFSQTYLTTLWDACFMPICDTFQFDTEADRQQAVAEHQLVLRPVWDWSEQFSERDKAFFVNPFYQKQRNVADLASVRRSTVNMTGAVMLPGLASPARPPRFSTSNLPGAAAPTAGGVPRDRYLEVRHRMSELAIWEQCYFRWMSVLEVKHGGFPQVELYHRLLLSNVAKLQRCLELQEFDDLPDVYYEVTGETRPDAAASNASNIEFIDGTDVERRLKPNGVSSAPVLDKLLPAVSSFFPFSQGSADEHPQLFTDILSSSHEMLLDGSIMDRLSIA